jgi:hypothetical protein
MSSGLPNDDTPSFAGNYGLDGYTMFEDYEGGVEEGGRLPDARPHAQLPDGMVAEFSGSPELGDDFAEQLEQDLNESEDDGIPDGVESEASDLGVLSDFMKEGNSIPGPVDFAWLESEQDPDRLPEPPVDKALKGIQESWGERTNGKTIYPLDYVDSDVARMDAVANDPANIQARMFSDEDLANIIQAAMRKSAAGEDLENILREVDRRIGLDKESLRRVRPLMAKVVEDHKLVGRVFLRSSAYPGCHNGRFKEEVKGKTSAAKYLISSAKCNGCVHAVNGSCAVYSKSLVREVPWKTAFNLYARKLQSTGVHVAATGNYEADLRKAIGARPVRQSKLSDERPVHVPVEQISEKAAMDALSKVKPEVKILKRDESKSIIKRVSAQVKRWHRAGLLTEGEVNSLLQEPDPRTMTKKASRLAQKRASSQSSEYTGAVFEQNTVTPVVSQARPQDVHDLLRWTSQRMSEGAFGADLNRRTKARFSAPVISAAADKLKMIRKEHEGLSGHLYVHAAAYASGTRDEGCAKGASKLRTSSLKLVLAMDRCKGCVRNHSGVCSRYNKKLSNKLPIRNKEVFKRSIMAKSGKTASSNEVVPSLDVNPVDEYDLYGSNELHVDFTQAGETLLQDGDVSFDGGIII